MPRFNPTEQPAPPSPTPHTGPHEPLELSCPECNEIVRVARADLVEGHAVRCRHCGTEPQLTREYDDLLGKTRWLLVDPRTDFDEDFR